MIDMAGMGAIIYIKLGLGLIRYCFSSSYRAEAHARWKQTPQRGVYEVGGGILGLVIVGAIIAVIVVSSR
jgi:hypothetical protein